MSKASGLTRAMTVKDLKEWILQLLGVTEAAHRFGGTEYRLQNMEFMHSHGSTHLDIRLSKQDQEQVLKEGKAEPHLYAPQAGYVTFRIRSARDVEAAKEIVQLAYDNAHRLLASHADRRNESRISAKG